MATGRHSDNIKEMTTFLVILPTMGAGAGAGGGGGGGGGRGGGNHGKGGNTQRRESGGRRGESCVKVEVAVLGSLSLIVLMVSVEVHNTEPCLRIGHSLFLIIMSTRHPRTLSSTSSSVAADHRP